MGDIREIKGWRYELGENVHIFPQPRSYLINGIPINKWVEIPLYADPVTNSSPRIVDGVGYLSDAIQDACRIVLGHCTSFDDAKHMAEIVVECMIGIALRQQKVPTDDRT